ncbi:transposase [uncultured Thiodictyon sp.]|uniref:transposase n=1 Tax=uncultured Thiodictyon sp. TaxID=1846217 RepID=UPI0025F98EB8|nr:transposase [uncultured Thiodictyon sp.]
MQTFIERYIEQGEKRGEQRGEAKILLRLIESKFGPQSEPVRQQLLEADTETLLHWSDRILTADSLEAIFNQENSCMKAQSAPIRGNFPEIKS